MRFLLAALLLLLMAAAPAAAGSHPSGTDPGWEGYRAARSAALGLATVGFLLGAAGMGLNGSRPEAYHHSRNLALLCAVLFVLLVTDRIVVRGLTAWFHLPDSFMPPWWR